MSISAEINRIKNAKENMISALSSRGADIESGVSIEEIYAHILSMNVVGKDANGVYFEPGITATGYVLAQDDTGVYVEEG